MSTVTKSTSFALAAAAAALLSGCNTPMTGGDEMTKTAASVEGKCVGINSCKGTSACATASSACAGQNACKGQGWVKATQSDCEAKGGTFDAG
ncbi:MAG: hypothetical protein KDJ38_19365 [Gammaproteobacteria bacterium]|nr:hypothetical protein [Gammaproteobacteria bacterium]